MTWEGTHDTTRGEVTVKHAPTDIALFKAHVQAQTMDGWMGEGHARERSYCVDRTPPTEDREEPLTLSFTGLLLVETSERVVSQ